MADLKRLGRTDRATPTSMGLLLGTVVVPGALGISTVSVALPELSEDLDLSAAASAWVLAGYVLAQAVSVAVFGRLADVRGVRFVLVVGGACAATGSVLAVVANSLVPLVCGRVLQGAGAGALWVAAFGVIAALFVGRERGKVVAIVTACLNIISGAGPLIGGLLADWLTWRAVLAVPAVSLLALTSTSRHAPSLRSREARVDIRGAALVVVLASSAIVLVQSPTVHLPRPMIVLLALAATCSFAALAIRTRTVRDGFIPLPVVRSRRFALGSFTALTLFASYVGVLYAAPLLLSETRQWTPTQIGLLLSPAAVLATMAVPIAGRMVDSWDPFKVAAGCAAMCVAGLALAGAQGGNPMLAAFAMALALTGYSCGHVVLVSTVALAVEPAVRNAANGLYTLTFRFGGALGPAIVAGLIGPLGLRGAVVAAAMLPVAGVAVAWSGRQPLSQGIRSEVLRPPTP